MSNKTIDSGSYQKRDSTSKESYMHKMAKELLYAEIERNSEFCGKYANGHVVHAKLTNRDDYRGECVLMEFVTHVGSPHYPDETLCEIYGCSRLPSEDRKCAPGSRFNDGKGYCACASCDWLGSCEKYIIHDIAAFWKGYVAWAIEIVNKHTPDWEYEDSVREKQEYPIYIVKAENVLKRVSNTPVFIERCLCPYGVEQKFKR